MIAAAVFTLFVLAPDLRGAGDAPERERCDEARRGVVFYRGRAWEYAGRHDAARRATGHAERSPGCAYVRWAARRWRGHALRARAAYLTWLEQTYERWRCIHEHEGAWSSNTGNGYFGGIQMTIWFQRTYAPEFVARWGTADRWPVWAQLLAGERARISDGDFHQWGTAGMCGLA